MIPAHPDEQEDPNDMDDGKERPDDSDESNAKVQAVDTSQRLASNPNIINK